MRSLEQLPQPKHGFRDTFFVYALLGMLVVLFAVITGGHVERSLLVAVLLFVVGSTYSLVRWHDFAHWLLRRDR